MSDDQPTWRDYDVAVTPEGFLFVRVEGRWRNVDLDGPHIGNDDDLINRHPDVVQCEPRQWEKEATSDTYRVVQRGPRPDWQLSRVPCGWTVCDEGSPPSLPDLLDDPPIGHVHLRYAQAVAPTVAKYR